MMSISVLGIGGNVVDKYTFRRISLAPAVMRGNFADIYQN